MGSKRRACKGVCFEGGYTGIATCYPMEQKTFDWGTLYKNPTFTYGYTAFDNNDNSLNNNYDYNKLETYNYLMDTYIDTVYKLIDLESKINRKFKEYKLYSLDLIFNPYNYINKIAQGWSFFDLIS